MPNHVTTVIRTADPAIAAALLGTDEHGHPCVDFNKVIPEPANIEQGGCPHFGGELLAGGIIPGTNEVCWYHWHIANWGTKWGAYSTEVDREDGMDVIKFQTAWSVATPVLTALAAQHPTASFGVEYADEDLGYNCGTIAFANGVVVPEATRELGGTDEGANLAAQILYGKSYRDYRIDTLRSEVEWTESRLEEHPEYDDAEYREMKAELETLLSTDNTDKDASA